MTPRLRWQKAIKSDQFPRTERAIRGTLLCLVELMSPGGDLMTNRDQRVAATGLPDRTIDRHLARAVAAGWLQHERHAGQGRRSIYRAAIPSTDSTPKVARYSSPNKGNSAPSTRALSARNSAPHSGALNRHRASLGEHEAVDVNRGTQRAPAPIGSGDTASDTKGNSGTYMEWLPTPVISPSSLHRGEVA